MSDLGHDERDILTCVRTVESDVQLDIEDLADIRIPAARLLPSRISSIKMASDDVLIVRLRTPPNQPFQFLAGQYIDVIGSNSVRRSYSLANYFESSGELELHIKKVSGGVLSQYWFEQAKINDLLRINGPLGTFFLRDCAGKELVFLATGTGIAPVKSIVESLNALSADNQPAGVTIFWGGRTQSDLYWQPDDVHTQGKVKFVPVLSRPSAGWSGDKGYVQNILLESGIPLSNTLVYACGSENMIKSAYDLLLENGLPKNQFFSDAFVCSSNS